MEKILVTNRKKIQRDFFIPTGVVQVTEGDNWITSDDLDFLTENSPGFQHYLKEKTFKVKDEKRPESEKEKEQRESLLKRAGNAVSSMFPAINRRAPAADAPVMSPAMLDISVFVAQFDKSVAESLSKALNDFQEKAKILSVQLSADPLIDFENKIKLLSEQLLTDLKTQAAASIKLAITDNISTFNNDMSAAIETQKQDFEKSILEAQVTAENDFTENIEKASGEAEKKFKQALKKAQK